jgi:hypothetical protein
VNGIFQYRKITERKERKPKSINRNSHNHRFPEETKIASKSPAYLFIPIFAKSINLAINNAP